MAKRSGRDRNRDAARARDHDGEGKGARTNRKLARELGQTSKLLDAARSVEARRLRQLDEAAAEVARLEAEMRRIEAELAGASSAAPPAAESAEPESAEPGPAAPEPAAEPAASERSATERGQPRASRRGRAAQAASLEAELARLDAARESDLRGTELEMDHAADVALEAVEVPIDSLDEFEAPADAETAADAEVATGADVTTDAEHADAGSEAPAADDDASVIRLGAGAATIPEADLPGFLTETPVEGPDGDAAESPGWTAGSGLPFRSGRNGSAAPAEHDVADASIEHDMADASAEVSPESARREPAAAPDPTARSWPQRRQQRARS